MPEPTYGLVLPFDTTPPLPDQSNSTTWAERVSRADEAWHRWSLLPGRFRMDRAFKEAGVRDLIAENDQLHRELASAVAQIEQLKGALAAAAPDEERHGG